MGKDLVAKVRGAKSQAIEFDGSAFLREGYPTCLVVPAAVVSANRIRCPKAASRQMPMIAHAVGSGTLAVATADEAPQLSSTLSSWD